MKKYILALAFLLVSSTAFAQCNGIFNPGQICGNPGAVPALPRAMSSSQPTIPVTNFGAKCDGVTNDTTAIQSAINSAVPNGGNIVFPPGTCLVNGQLTIANNNIGLTGQGALISGSTGPSVIKSTSTTADVIHFNANLNNSRVSYLTIDGTGTQTSGSGIFVDNNSSTFLQNVTVQNRFIGFSLGCSNFSVIADSISQFNFSHGIQLFNSASCIPQQWEVHNVLSQNNNGWGFQFSTATGAANTTMGFWLHPNTFANTLGGIQIVGQSGAPVNDLFLSNFNGSSDGGDEFQLTPAGGSNFYVNGALLELAGQNNTGRTSATAPSHLGRGISILGNIASGDITINTIVAQHNSQEGLFLQSTQQITTLNVSGFQSLGNSQSVSGAGINIANNGTAFTLVGSSSYNDSGTSQTFGLITVPDQRVVIVGNNFVANNNNATGSCSITGNVFAAGNHDQDGSCHGIVSQNGAIFETGTGGGTVQQWFQTAGGATNPSKFWLLTSAGRIDLTNSAFSAALMRWNDAADPHNTVTVPGWLSVGADVAATNTFYVGGPASINTTNTNGTGLNVAGSVLLIPVTIAALPTCNAAQKGAIAFVSDTTASGAPAFHSSVVGGGATTVNSLVSCTGGGWQYD